MAALGTDIGGVEDFDAFISYATSPGQAAGEAIMCSLLHGPGVLWWAPHRGTDIRAYLHRDASEEEIRIAIEAEVAKEERVESAVVTVTKLGSEVTIQIDPTLTNDPAKVTLTLQVDAVAGVLAASVEVVE